MKWPWKKKDIVAGTIEAPRVSDVVIVSVPRMKEPALSMPLEETKQLSQEGTLLSRVELVENMHDIDYSAEFLWRYFNEMGEIINIGKDKSYDGEFKGSPEMKTASDGSLYPIKAVFEVKVSDSTYKVCFDSSRLRDGLEAKIDCPKERLEELRALFATARRDFVHVEKQYKHYGSLKKLYDFIKDKGTDVKLSSTNNHSVPKMIVMDEQGLLPIDANISTFIDGIKYVFTFSKGYGELSVTVESPMDKVKYIDKLLDQMTIKESEDGKKEIRTLDFSVSVENYGWDMIKGLDCVKDELFQYIEGPMRNPALFERLRLPMPKGILFHGPPGNGKTTLAKILANTTDSSFYCVSPKDINSRYVGGTEDNWGRLFDYARKDSKKGRSVIIFIDELDGFFTNRDDMDKYTRISFGQFCQEMDGFSDTKNVLILAATNKLDILDEALLRPGRFTKKIYIGNPDDAGRKDIFGLYLANRPLMGDIGMDDLMSKTGDFSSAKIEELCNSAMYCALTRFSRQNKVEIVDITTEMADDIRIGQSDFNTAMENMKEPQK